MPTKPPRGPGRPRAIAVEVVKVGLIGGLNPAQIAEQNRVHVSTVKRVIARERKEHGAGWPMVGASRAAVGLPPLESSPGPMPPVPTGRRTGRAREVERRGSDLEVIAYTDDELRDIARRELVDVAQHGGRDDGPRVAAARALLELAGPKPVGGHTESDLERAAAAAREAIERETASVDDEPAEHAGESASSRERRGNVVPMVGT